MIFENIKYNPQVDLAATIQDGWINLQESYQNGVIPGASTYDERPSNGISEPSKVGVIIRDRFQAARELQARTAARAAHKAAAAASAAAAATPAPAGAETA